MARGAAHWTLAVLALAALYFACAPTEARILVEGLPNFRGWVLEENDDA